MGPGELIAGRYRLERPLGEGGMKRVWRAADLQHGGAVAIAVLHHFDPQRFVHEVQLARRVQSPHVARVLDGVIVDGNGIVVSELCEGPDLDVYRRSHAVSAAEAVRLAHQMTMGLVAIHHAHVLHRDVKPANAILTAHGVKLIDFGISLPAVDHKTGVGGLVAPAGTLPYMAPETVTGDIDARTDTYALGVSLFELITGRLPLPDLSPYQLLHRLTERTPLPLDQLTGHDPRLVAMVARLCEVDRERRPYLAEIEPELGALAQALASGAIAPAAVTVVMGPAPAFGPSAVTTLATEPFRLPVRVPDPGRIVVGWPHLPILALTPIGERTRIVGFDPSGAERWAALVDDDLRGGVVADLDGDGVGELYAWSERDVHAIDAAGRPRLLVTIPPPPPLPVPAPDPSGRHTTHLSIPPGAPMPWDRGPPAPLVLDGAGERHLAVGGLAIDVVTGTTAPLAARYQGAGDDLIDIVSDAGLSAHGAARQCFRGDLATPAAILARRRVPGFVVASLERLFDGHPTIALGMWGPGGRRIASAAIGRYDFKTGPLEMFLSAQRPETVLFDAQAAPLAVLGRSPADDVVIVPFLINAPWFGPVLVAVDGTGADRWRARVPPLTRALAAPPMLCDLDGDGVQLLWGDGGAIQRRDARTGAERAPLASSGAPVAALDLGGRGRVHLVVWRPDAIEVHVRGPCLPGAVLWLPTRGDLWRSGTLEGGLPVGPRA